jgi:Fur family ferric uptake transcriptional regulator
MSKIRLEQQKLHDSGYKATPQRLTILAAINLREGHFTPQQLYKWLHEQYPGIGLVTVYRSLKALTRAGLVCEVQSAHNSRRYTRRSAEHHHHLICLGCDRVVDFDHCRLLKLEEDLSKETGFAINEHRLEFYGFCRHCKITHGKQ